MRSPEKHEDGLQATVVGNGVFDSGVHNMELEEEQLSQTVDAQVEQQVLEGVQKQPFRDSGSSQKRKSSDKKSRK